MRPAQAVRREPARLASARAGRGALLIFGGIACIIVAAHAPLLRLPYYWDELGQFIPAALDLYRHGEWVPRTTVPNVHPPGLMAYLALVWHVWGYSIQATRAAMLLLGSGCAFVTFLLALRMGGRSRAAALFAVLLLLVSPLFYTQAMLAQLDMPAALFSLWALLWFLEGRHRGAALVSTALVITKETGLVVPALFGVWLWFEGKRREALWFAIPAVPLAAWLGMLALRTGNPFGNAQFAEYNLTYPLHPVRLALALLRRAAYLFFENFHWVGWLAIAAAWKRGVFRSRAWRIAGTLAAVQVLSVTLLGGATLERYLVPVLPILYIAMANAFAALPGRRALAGRIALACGLLAGLFWNPPYPSPYENSFAVVDFVRLQQRTAQFLEANCEGRTITTMWPLSSALQLPELGYVSRPMQVREIGAFTPEAIGQLDPESIDVFVLYSRDWERPIDLRRMPWVSGLVRRLYGYERPVAPVALQQRLGLVEAAALERRGQWAAVFESARRSQSAPSLSSSASR